MNKKYIAYSFMAILAVTLVSAGLVNYLSNTAEVNINVSLPMLFEVSEDGDIWVGANEPATLNFGAVYGGESITFFAKDSNLANVDTVGDSSKIITCDSGVTCGDFISVIATTETKINGVSQSISPDYDLIDMGLCTEINETTIAFNYGAAGDPLVVGQADTTEITATFQPNVEGNYVFKLRKEVQ